MNEGGSVAVEGSLKNQPGVTSVRCALSRFYHTLYSSVLSRFCHTIPPVLSRFYHTFCTIQILPYHTICTLQMLPYQTHALYAPHHTQAKTCQSIPGTKYGKAWCALPRPKCVWVPKVLDFLGWC